MEQTAGYGEDEYCEQARELSPEGMWDARVDVHFLVGGTQTNANCNLGCFKALSGSDHGKNRTY